MRPLHLLCLCVPHLQIQSVDYNVDYNGFKITQRIELMGHQKNHDARLGSVHTVCTRCGGFAAVAAAPRHAGTGLPLKCILQWLPWALCAI